MVPFRAWISCKTQNKTFAFLYIWRSAFILYFLGTIGFFVNLLYEIQLATNSYSRVLAFAENKWNRKDLEKISFVFEWEEEKNCDIITATTQIARVISPSRHKWAFLPFPHHHFPYTYAEGREGKLRSENALVSPEKKLKWVWRRLMGVRRWKVHFTSSSSSSASQKRLGNKLTPKWGRGKTMCGRIFPLP